MTKKLFEKSKPDARNFHGKLQTSEKFVSLMSKKELCSGSELLKDINAVFDNRVIFENVL